MKRCTSCPRYCRVDRGAKATGACGAGNLPRVAYVDLHHWEEPSISGSRGSGAVFFSLCNLKCVFCQNHVISTQAVGRELTPRELAMEYISLEERGAHNINLVSPTHFAESVAQSISIARDIGLQIPVVYNCNGYESLENLEILDGLVQVYMPDLKYCSDELALRYSGAPRYFQHATRAIMEMSRQVGIPVLDRDGILQKGLIVRHLVLPGFRDDSEACLRWISENLPKGTYVSLMSQYYPCYRAQDFPEINRTVREEEYAALVNLLEELGLEDGYVQEPDSQDPAYTPDFARGIKCEERS